MYYYFLRKKLYIHANQYISYRFKITGPNFNNYRFHYVTCVLWTALLTAHILYNYVICLAGVKLNNCNKNELKGHILPLSIKPRRTGAVCIRLSVNTAALLKKKKPVLVISAHEGSLDSGDDDGLNNVVLPSCLLHGGGEMYWF